MDLEDVTEVYQARGYGLCLSQWGYCQFQQK